ncbi:MAG: Abi family protein [Magnetococcales bacterium]|nr:Abi family protein [Magnetococcales bacterium]
MTKCYTKQPLNLDDQLELLASRGLDIGNRNDAREKLSAINYYRLSGYWHSFRARNSDGMVTDAFRTGNNLTNIITLYEFDRHLRLMVMDALERVEIAVRTQITYHLALTYGTFAHTNPAHFSPKFQHDKWLAGIDEEAKRSKEPFILHFRNNYQGFPTLPIWMATEVVSMGALSILYQGMTNQDRKMVSSHFGVHHMRFSNDLHALTYIRNICAHHGRLWNRELAIKPHRSHDPRWQPPVTPRHDRIFYILLILRQLLAKMGLGEHWQHHLTDLITPIATHSTWRVSMGLPEQWKDHPLWHATP